MRMRIRFAAWTVLAAALLLPLPGVAAHRHKSPPKPHFDLKRPEIASFITDVVRRDGLQRRAVVKILSKGEPQPKILEAMTRPAEKVSPWYEYRDHFLTEERVADGTQFYLEHRDTLERVAGQRGIAPEYLVAILGVETKYGRTMGHYRVLDALMTLAFDYPPR
ncbi:MAG: lytic murein transglycosylase, partial [Sinobacteraceae bacterium]|nr:lytic murein transglycosylase [Nevskiaceae bacterium]